MNIVKRASKLYLIRVCSHQLSADRRKKNHPVISVTLNYVKLNFLFLNS